MGFCLQSNGLLIRAKNASPHHEPQTAGALKHQRPIERQFYLPAGWYRIVHFEKNAVRADVKGPAESK
jgi:hypothetical protein